MARLAEVRGKLGFLYLPPDRQPVNTRHLPVGQKMYVLAAGPDRLRLLRAEVLELDDLEIRTGAFADSAPARLPEAQGLWAYFWSETGSGHRFVTRILKTVQEPVWLHCLAHGDRLARDESPSVLACGLSQDLAAEWLPTADLGRTAITPRVLERYADRVRPLALHLIELSGSGLSFASAEPVQPHDLVRIPAGESQSPLSGAVVRIVQTSASRASANFVGLAADQRDRVLSYVAARLSIEAVRRKLKRRLHDA